MRRELGDILPDVSDDCRYNLIQHKVPYYHKIVENCDSCNGLGFKTSAKTQKQYECSCKSSLKLVVELLKSNFPQQHLNIYNDDLFVRKVVELDIKNSSPIGKPFIFNSMMSKYIDNRNYMINNSCSMLFCGNNESGKTYAAIYMLAQLIREGFSGHYLRFKNYLNLLNSSYANQNDKIILRQIREVKFLVLDELGKEHGKTDYATCELEELIKTRQDNMSSTVMITNLDYDDFTATYGNHVKSAFNKNFRVLTFHPDAAFRERTRIAWEG